MGDKLDITAIQQAVISGINGLTEQIFSVPNHIVPINHEITELESLFDDYSLELNVPETDKIYWTPLTVSPIGSLLPPIFHSLGFSPPVLPSGSLVEIDYPDEDLQRQSTALTAVQNEAIFWSGGDVDFLPQGTDLPNTDGMWGTIISAMFTPVAEVIADEQDQLNEIYPELELLWNQIDAAYDRLIEIGIPPHNLIELNDMENNSYAGLAGAIVGVRGTEDGLKLFPTDEIINQCLSTIDGFDRICVSDYEVNILLNSQGLYFEDMEPLQEIDPDVEFMPSNNVKHARFLEHPTYGLIYYNSASRKIFVLDDKDNPTEFLDIGLEVPQSGNLMEGLLPFEFIPGYVGFGSLFYINDRWYAVGEGEYHGTQTNITQSFNGVDWYQNDITGIILTNSLRYLIPYEEGVIAADTAPGRMAVIDNGNYPLCFREPFQLTRSSEAFDIIQPRPGVVRSIYYLDYDRTKFQWEYDINGRIIISWFEDAPATGEEYTVQLMSWLVGRNGKLYKLGDDGDIIYIGGNRFQTGNQGYLTRLNIHQLKTGPGISVGQDRDFDIKNCFDIDGDYESNFIVNCNSDGFPYVLQGYNYPFHVMNESHDENFYLGQAQTYRNTYGNNYEPESTGNYIFILDSSGNSIDIVETWSVTFELLDFNGIVTDQKYTSNTCSETFTIPYSDPNFSPEITDIPGVEVSSDNGLSWMTAGNLYDLIYSIVIDPNDSSTIYAAGVEYLWKTTDGGTTWNEVTTYTERPFVVKMIGSTLWVGGDRGLKSSTDGGSTFTSYGFTTSTILDISIYDSNIIYVASYGTGAYKTINGGTNWTEINTGLRDLVTDPVFSKSIIVNPSNSLEAYVGTEEKLYKTINGGTNWTEFKDRISPNQIVIGSNDTDIFVAADDGVYSYIEDPGNPGNWDWIYHTLINVTIDCIEINPSNDLFCGTANYVYKSNNKGSSWDISYGGGGTIHNIKALTWEVPTSKLYMGKRGAFEESEEVNETFEPHTYAIMIRDLQFFLVKSTDYENWSQIWSRSYSGSQEAPVRSMMLKKYGDNLFLGLSVDAEGGDVEQQAKLEIWNWTLSQYTTDPPYEQISTFYVKTKEWLHRGDVHIQGNLIVEGDITGSAPIDHTHTTMDIGKRYLAGDTIPRGTAVVSETITIYDDPYDPYGSERTVILPAGNWNIFHCNSIVGVTVSEIIRGETGIVITDGVVENSLWNWEQGKPLYVTLEGQLTQTPPNPDTYYDEDDPYYSFKPIFIQIIGYAITETRIYVKIQQPILFEGAPEPDDPYTFSEEAGEFD